MADLSPDPQGAVMAALADALTVANRLQVAVAYVPTLANRTTHLDAIEAAQAGLTALIPVLDPPYVPEEE